MGAGSPAFDWSEDAAWELRNENKACYHLDESLAELGPEAGPGEMFTLPCGLLVRQRNGRAVNLTVLKGDWEMLRNGQSLARVGQSWEEWHKQLGDPLTIYVNPEKNGHIYYYRASLLDLGLMVSEARVLSLMFVEPGYLRSALERSGYRAQP